jgi:hypothetical protein
MKTKTLLAAINIGFDLSTYEPTDTLESIYADMLSFLHENTDKLEVTYNECEVRGHGTTQTVSHGDFVRSGEIIDWSYYWYKERQQIDHSDYLYIDNDGTPYKMVLWCWSKDEETIDG